MAVTLAASKIVNSSLTSHDSTVNACIKLVPAGPPVDGTHTLYYFLLVSIDERSIVLVPVLLVQNEGDFAAFGPGDRRRREARREHWGGDAGAGS